MGVLASRLPHDHPYAAGYPGVGSQPLPTDSDAKDYLARVKEKDGVAVEVGVANAVDTFFKSAKASGVYESLRACCIMAGARTLSGALVPLRRDYGQELVDIDNLPTPYIYNTAGTGAVWDAATRTATTTAIVGNNSFPRIFFEVGMTNFKRYRIKGRLSGNYGPLYGGGIRCGVSNYIQVQADGTFDGVHESNSFDGKYGAICILLHSGEIRTVTIEELSIREDNFTPTPLNLAPTDYVRGGSAPGIKGNGSTKYLDANRSNNVDPQNDNHLAVYATVAATTGNTAYAGELGTVKLLYEGGATFYARANASSYTTVAGGNVAGFLGAARSDSSSQTVRANGTTASQAVPSATTGTQRVTVFSRLTSLFSPARLAFYSLGPSTDLASLDSHVSQLIEDIGNVV